MGIAMRALKAQVRGGRLVLDEPTDLPEGTEVELTLVDDGDEFSPEERARISVVQQARAEDGERVRGIYAGLGVKAEIAPFFKDLPARMAASHLVVARSGASTIAELSVVGRPALLVPLPGSLDQDQAANAAVLEKAGGAIRIMQPDFTPRRLAGELSGLLADPSRLTAMAASAKSAGIPDAADRLARLIAETAQI